MDPTTLRLMQGAAGAAESATYVDDVFSTTLYTATGSSLSLTTGQDLNAEGGMVWLKSRSASRNHAVVDSARGVDGTGNYKSLYPNLTDVEYSPGSAANAVATSFDSNGLTLGNNTNTNTASDTGVAWTFRKAPGFFDVVTWAGDGTGTRNIPHSLGSTPGCVILKRTNQATNWFVQHRSLSNGFDSYLTLNTTNAETATGSQVAVSSTELTLGGYYNASSYTYIAYIFAHDDQSFGTNSDEAIIKCGSYNEPSSGSTTQINLGFEPQWILWKKTDGGGNWYIFDTMRGLTVSGQGFGLFADGTNVEQDYFGGTPYLAPTSTGFSARGGYFGAGSNMIYIAIRRPNKPVTSASEVFDTNLVTTGTPSTTFTSGFVTDAIIYPFRTFGAGPRVSSRLTGNPYLDTSSSGAETGTTTNWDSMTGLEITSSSGISLVDYMFRRAPGFFDVVAYTGNSSARDINHNLGVTPQLIILKSRTLGESWPVLSTLFSDVTANRLTLNLNGALSSGTAGFFKTPTATTFGIGSTAPSEGQWNRSGEDYIAYLFATLDGISKVGTYSGTGSDVDVDCGFSAGARFILIKRTDSTGDWYTYDSARGITSGNDPYLLLNSSAAEVTGTDYIDPLNSGFTVTSTAPAGMNASGGTYLFLAIA